MINLRSLVLVFLCAGLVGACGSTATPVASAPSPTQASASSALPTSASSVTPGGTAPAGSPTAVLIEPLTTEDQRRPLAAGGTYYVDDPFPVRASFSVTEGWGVFAYTHAATQINLQKRDRGEVSLEIVDNVSADPCTAELPDPPVGPSVDDLVTALSKLGEFGFDVSPATDIAIDGFSGKQLTLHSPPNTTPDCDGWKTWRTTTRQNGVGPDEVNEVRILDVDGVRLLISVARGAYLPPEARADIDALLESLQLGN